VLTREEEKAKAQDYFNVWFPQSKEFVIDAKNALQRLSLNNSAFYLHQSIESLYYTILLVHTGYKPKTHNIWKLRKKAKAYSEEMFLVFQAETNPEDKRLFELLKRGYIEARYKQKEYEIAAWEVEELIARVLQSQRIVEDSCTNKINSIAN
jgi:HEPN domain-containing protein